MQNENQIIITGANLRFSGFCAISSFSDWFRICGKWSVLYYNIYKKLHINEFSYKFDTETSDGCLMCIVQRLRFSGFILYPLSFFLYSPFNNELFCGNFSVWPSKNLFSVHKVPQQNLDSSIQPSSIILSLSMFLSIYLSRLGIEGMNANGQI